MKTKISIALLIALVPVLVPSVAYAGPKTPTVHVRQQAYHDRTPKARVHESLPHHA
jgi:hypothetical protein